MAFCSNCGQPLEENSNFCGSCGMALTEKKKEKRNFKFDFKKIMASILIITVLGIILYNPVKNFAIRRNPYNWLLYGIYKTSKQKNIDSSTKIRLNLDVETNYEDEKKLKEFINNIYIQVDSKQNYDYKQYFSKVSVMYKDETFISGNFYVDNNILYFNFPQLYDGDFYIEIEELKRFLEDVSDFKNVKYEKYKQLLDVSDSLYFKNMSKDYYEFFKLNLEPNILKAGDTEVLVNKNGDLKSVSCDMLTFNSDIARLTEKFLIKIANDYNVKGFAKEKIQQFLDIAKANNDLEKFDITEDGIDNFNKKFDSNYDEFMEELKQEAVVNEKDVPFDLKMNFKFDSKNIIRGMETDIKIHENDTKFNVKYETVINAVGDDVIIGAPNYKKAKNISNMGEEEISNIFEEIERNLEKLIEDKVDAIN